MEIPKEEVPKKELLKSEIPKKEVAEKATLKKGVQIRFWWIQAVMMFLAMILGALATLFSPQMIKIFKSDNQITSRALSPHQREIYDQAISLWRDGAYSEALKELDSLISQRPDYVDAYNMKGRIYMDNLQYQDAVDVFKRGLQKDPKNKHMLYNLGLAYYWLGDFKQAISWNDSALAQDPDLIIAVYNSALYRVDYGERYNDESYYREAIRLYEIVINRGQEFTAAAMFNLAALYARFAGRENNQIVRGQYVEKAVELLDRSIERGNKEGNGLERLKKVTGQISVPYGKDIEILYSSPAYQSMITKWKEHLKF